MFELVSTMIGGLGLFFAGVWLLTENLKRATGRRFRKAVIAWTRHRSQGFAWGVLFGAITQSMQAIVFILVSMLTAGLIRVRTALPVIAGANFGSAVLTLLLSTGLRGRSMQVAAYQAALNILGCLILVPLSYVERYAGIPLMRHLVESITSDVGSQMAYVYLFFNLVGATALLSIKIAPLLERYWPPSKA